MLRNKGRQQGFTLIEIIAVLIILGILALIAIPRYQDIVDQARDSAANQAVAEGMARLNQAFAECLLDTAGNMTDCNTVENLTDGDYLNGTVTAEDYTITISGDTDCTATVVASGLEGGEANKTDYTFCE